jgi:fructosamine-3-kinase
MASFKPIKITSKELKDFTNFQKSIFFSKADIPRNHTRDLNYKLLVNSVYKKIYKKTPNKVVHHSKSSLHAVYEIPGNKSVIRFNKYPKIKEYNFLIESEIIRFLQKRNLNDLKVDFVDISRTAVPTDYQVLKFVQGSTLWDLSEKKGNFKLFFKLGVHIAKIHKLRTKGYGPFILNKALKFDFIGIYKKWSDFLNCNFGEHVVFCLNKKIIRKEEVREIEKIFSYAFKKLPKVRPALLHGDLANQNVFIKNGNITLIDWEDAISGDPIFDVAYFGTGAYGKENWENLFLEGYTSILKLPKDYQIRYWTYYLRIAIAKAVVREKEGRTDKKINQRIGIGLSRLSNLV